MRKPGVMLALTVALVAPAAATPVPSVGDAVQIITDREMEEHGNRADSQQGTSTDRDNYVERVTAVRQDGVVLEYDLPGNATKDDRASN